MTDNIEHRVTVIETQLVGHFAADDRRWGEMLARQAAMEGKIDTLIAVLNMGKGARNILFLLGGAVASGAGILAAWKWW